MIGRVRRLLDSSYSDLPRVEHSALVPAIGLRRSSMRYGIMANAMNDSESSLSSPASEMKAQDVIEILRVFEHHGIEVHVDGGWAVDALLGQQTRPHADLDIAIQHKDAPLVRALLAAQGFREIPRDDSWECNVVLEDERGRQIDIHSYTFDAAGNHVYGVPYPRESLSGQGGINGYPVQCIAPEWLVRFHTGYMLDEQDYHDVKLLCEHFGFVMPVEYAIFEDKTE
ncbi:nucleotidyltransferase domain-containing protein [Roseiflexus sp.]|uniref:nucleotidyltransferase domain-containing protein n=1 Tax=Roseiflexus sp. TaxID=2562120 RepID=UPI0021DDBA01|nr:nucleotidyltransferase family protein [Roseiflexus sp.]GIV99982.1 MAG: hypothetical protein KatS3mg058_1386 [Roseiflexus sp.]